MRFTSVLLLAAALIVTTRAQNLPVWDMALTGQIGQATTYMSDPGGGFCGVPVELGDFDDDGFVDYAVAPILADGGPLSNRTDSGRIIVIKGNGTIGGIINQNGLPAGQPLLTIYGAAAFDLAGTELYAADFTNDGIPDLIIGASGADENGVDRAGAVYVVPGGPLFNGVIDLANPPAGVITFQGQDLADRLGFWVEAGDINGDGIEDLLMSADDGNGINNAFFDRGEAHVIYGGQTLPAVVDMANPPVGLQYLTVYGVDNGDQLGSCMHAVDLDGDGFEELIVSAALNRAVGAATGAGSAGADGPSNGRPNCGETYVIWGSASLPAVIDLSVDAGTMLANGALTLVYGADPLDYLGEEISSGNLDGDAYNDLLIGAITGDGENNTQTSAGDAVILWGGPQLRGQVIDMATTPAGTSTLYGEQAGDIGGDTLAIADVNGDGFDDICFAEPNGDPQRPGGNVSNAGEMVILYGGPLRFPSAASVTTIDNDLDYPSRRIWGTDAGDLMGYSMEAGDFDDDGFADIFPNSMRGDGAGNAFTDAGEVGIVSGHRFSRGIVTVTNAPTLGALTTFQLVADPGQFFVALFSLAATPSQPVAGNNSLFLANDGVFMLSQTHLQPYFANTLGFVGPTGRVNYGIFVPQLPGAAGTRMYTAYGTANVVGPVTITLISATTSFVLQ